MVQGNDGELQQVFTNLMLNAMDAMSGEGDITLALCADAGRVRATVRDNGPGIPETALEKIFQPFYTHQSRPGRHRLGSRHQPVDHRAARRRLCGPTIDPSGGAEFTVELPELHKT